MTYEDFVEICNISNYAMDYYNAKVVHCINLHESIEKRVDFSLIKKDAIKNVLNYKKEVVDDWTEQLIKNKCISSGPTEKLEYLNINISNDFTLEMLINEFFSHIHSIFDLIAFLINETVLQQSIKKVSKISYHNIIQELKRNKKHPKLLSILNKVQGTDWYKYIDDFTNLAKHRYLANIISTSYLDTGEILVKIPEFERKEKHEEIEAFDVIYICFDEVLVLLKKIFQYIKLEVSNIKFEDRYHRDSMYYKIQMSKDPGSGGANAFLITGEKTYKEGDNLYINIATRDEDLNKVKKNDKNHAIRVFLKNRREDELPYAIAEQITSYKKRSMYDYIEYEVKNPDDIKKKMSIDFFEHKRVHGNNLTDEINWIIEG